MVFCANCAFVYATRPVSSVILLHSFSGAMLGAGIGSAAGAALGSAGGPIGTIIGATIGSALMGEVQSTIAQAETKAAYYRKLYK